MSPSASAIERLRDDGDLEQCAKLMAGQEPWITLGRTLESSRHNLRDPGKEVYVMKADGAVIGFVVIDLRGPFPGYLQTVCVRADHQSSGIGSRLIAHAEARIFQTSPNVFLCVSTFNPRARRLYERLGYTEVGELTDYIVPGHGEILLRKTRGTWSTFTKT